MQSKIIQILSYRNPRIYSKNQDSDDDWIQNIHFGHNLAVHSSQSTTRDDAPLEIRSTTLVVESIGFQQSSVGLALAPNLKYIQNVDGRIELDSRDDHDREPYPVGGKSLFSSFYEFYFARYCMN